LHKSQEGSKEKGIAMTTGFNILRLCVNVTNNEFLFAYGWPGQRAVRFSRQTLFLHFLLAILIFFCNCSMNRTGALEKRAGRGKGDEKGLTLRQLKRISYDPPVQNRSALTMSLPSGEYRSEQSRHVRFFQRPYLDFYATLL